jgi:hypothetical protein
MLDWLVKHKGIAPYVPVWDKSARKDGTFAASDFTWDATANEYRCPVGQVLRSQWRAFTNPRSHITKADTIPYHSSKRDRQHCSLKPQCCPNTPTRKIARGIHEDAGDLARRIMDTPQYQQSRYERKKVEMLFAHLKRIMKLDRLRLRGLSGAHDEFLLAATAHRTRNDFLFSSRISASPHLSTRQYARIIDAWIESIGLDSTAYGTHTMRRKKATLIYRRSKNLRAVRLLLGHTKLESTVRYRGIEGDDALEIAEQTEMRTDIAPVRCPEADWLYSIRSMGGTKPLSPRLSTWV